MNTRIIFLVVSIIIIVGAIVYLELMKADVQSSSNATSSDIVTTTNDSRAETATTDSSKKAAKYELAKEISSPDGFINVDDITVQEHIGKNVILIDFWTYSCINCQRTLPYLNAWHDKYADQGLVIVGLHTPEFEFEKEYENVLQAVKKFEVQYPVVLDNDFSTWKAYKNRYWPHKYLIDIDGYIVYDHIGEGGYEETEKVIQKLLEERTAKLGGNEEISSDTTVPTQAEITVARSPEVYLGAWRNELLGNGTPGQEGVQTMVEPEKIKENMLYLDGQWNIETEYAENASRGAKIIFKYQADKVHMVLGSEEPITATVLRDGEPVGDAAGDDVDSDTGTVTIQEEGLYRLIDEPSGFGEHTFELIIEEPGVHAFTFTFG